MTTIRVADLRPNPFRNLKHYPIDQTKVDALKRSIKDTTFWDNLLARKAPDGDGFEIAYGHHRLTALKAMRIDEINIPVRPLDNTAMARIMAHENMEEWGHSAAIEQETVRAIIEAYGAGEIDLPRAASNGMLRYAPAYTPGPSPDSSLEKTYTVDTLEKFLGWKRYKIESALSALALIERDLAKPETFKDLSSKQADAVASQGQRILRETGDPVRAKAVVNGLAAGMRKSTGKKTAADGSKRNLQDVTIHTARREADRMAGTRLVQHKSKKLPDLEKFSDALITGLARFFEQGDARWKAVIAHRKHLSASKRNRLVSSFRRAARDLTAFADKLEQE